MAIGRARHWTAMAVLLPAFGLPALTFAAEARRVDFGTLQDGTRVAAVELSNGAGMSVRIIALGAAIQSLSVPDRKGKVADVVLGYATAREYLAKPQYFGATVGRYANRIAHGKFTLDGQAVHARDQRRAQSSAWRRARLRQGTVEDRLCDQRLAGTRRAELREPGRRRRLSWHVEDDCDLYAERAQRAVHRIPRHARTGRRSSTSPITRYFNLAGASGHSDILEPSADGVRRRVHAGRCDADSDRRAPHSRGHARSTFGKRACDRPAHSRRA